MCRFITACGTCQNVESDACRWRHQATNNTVWAVEISFPSNLGGEPCPCSLRERGSLPTEYHPDTECPDCYTERMSKHHGWYAQDLQHLSSLHEADFAYLREGLEASRGVRYRKHEQGKMSQEWWDRIQEMLEPCRGDCGDGIMGCRSIMTANLVSFEGR
jgi:hypothetical protein